MSSDILSNAERQIARCQSEHPDIYDAHYDAIEQLKAIPKNGCRSIATECSSATPAEP